MRSVGLGAQSVMLSRLRQRLGPLHSAPTTPPRAGCPRSRARAYIDPRPCFQLARKPDNLRVNRFIRTQTRSLARGQRRPRAHLAVNVRINGPICTSSGQRAHRRAHPASHQARHLAARIIAHVRGRGSPVGAIDSEHPQAQPHSPTARTTRTHARKHTKNPGLVTFSRTRPGPSQVNEPDYSRKFMPKSMAPSASRKSSDTEPSPKSASE